ncbi:hypothetical protein BJ170DRAFT_175738 [Xylariales sp. AK1849]|nr:hypothetical protein BJ170DRAFT_175738 [Xylariales sp. AK1849]
MTGLDSTMETDLLILTDATFSMGSYLQALNQSLPKIISVSTLTGAFTRIGVLAYRDYCAGELTEWSGWYGRDGDISQELLMGFTRRLTADHGGDWPEATKTGLARAYSVMRAGAHTLILLYTDAPPHMPWNMQANRLKERANLRSGAFGTSSELFADWVSATRTLRSGSEQGKKAQVFSIVKSHLVDTLSPYVYMAHGTGGSCFGLHDESPNTISNLTMSVLLAWMSVNKPGLTKPTPCLATHVSYKNTSGIINLQSEDDPAAASYFLQIDTKAMEEIVRDNMKKTKIDDSGIGASITPRAVPVLDFAKRYLEDEGYRAIVVEQLHKIIQEDVSSIAINPVFGGLWRAVCNDRNNDARDGLIQKFGASIEKTTTSDEKERMKTWLAESYNYAAEIASTIEEVTEEDKFPCVFLDPTQDWKTSASEIEDDETVPISSFSRDELLEVGRSCDYRILRRLGRVLTQLTYVESIDEMPGHIRDMSEEEVPRIPLALAKPAYQRPFWKILLHIVVPGTKLGARPAALLAALSIKMGIKPLLSVADSEMIGWKANWNNLEIPETWNTNCLSLILDADKSFEKRRKVGTIAPDLLANAAFLSNEDRQLFETLVDYGMLKANINTTLTAKVGWRPEKSKMPIGPLVVCNACQFPRSVTMMAPGGICGMCAIPERAFANGNTKAESLLINVSKDQTESVEATWVECSIATCRAQYIVYDSEGLRVRPKCHYCRLQSMVPEEQRNPDPAPWVECRKCLNRIIWPEAYRPTDGDFTCFYCTACSSGRATIIDADTTPKTLSEENGNTWLLRNIDSKIQKPFGDHSLYKTIFAAGIEGFAAKVEVLPNSTIDTELKIRGKLIHNVDEIKASLQAWIKSRRVEAGACSLCFSDFKKADLRSACGRSGCLQKICTGCQEQWYGINARGRSINIAALFCPFCRRQPAPRAVPHYDIVFLGNLRGAVEDNSWIYAWCNDCGFAKRFVERMCAQGAPPEVSEWECEECADNSRQAPVERKKIRHCPGCDVATEKTGGCNHIECTCGTHWCFDCGEKALNGPQVYRHMSERHGGIYGGGYDGDEEEDEDDDACCIMFD